MATILYFDCFAGIAGDMVLGALIDAGLPLGQLETALGSLSLPDSTIWAGPVLRSGVGATKFRVHEAHDPHAPHHHAGGGSHTHRTLAEIGDLIEGCALSREGKARAVRLFRRLAETEAEVHRTSVDDVLLHEVGSLDSIIDIVGAVFAVEYFKADVIVSSPLNVGGGTVKTAHGEFPVPAPATAKLLADVPIYSSGVEAELVTPTGALLITEFASRFGPIPAMRIDRVGYGAGDRELPGAPNVLRVLVGRTAAAPERAERILVMECEIDDMNPQIFGVVMEQLYDEGALEVYYTPVQMKKNRPGTLLTVIGAPEQREALSSIVFRETTTIGLRYQEMDRECLERESQHLDTPVGPVHFKVARRQGEVVNAAPEFEDCARLAAERGLSIKEVQAIATRAYWDRRQP
jgi:pyridinium-3,5-bisthiocarboxylic acid mononucleotide nickel chelatase